MFFMYIAEPPNRHLKNLESPTPKNTNTKNNSDNEKTNVHLETSKTSVLLQKATTIVLDTKEKR